MASIEVKQISSLCNTRMRVNVSVYEKYANPCLRIYTERTQRFACLYDTETGCVCVSSKPLNTATFSFRGPRTCTHERFRWSK